MKLWLQPQPSRWSHRRFDATDARWIRNSSARFWPHSGALLLWSGSSVVNKQTNKQTDKHLLTQRLRPPSTLMAIKLNTWTDVCSFRIDNRWLSDTIDMKDGLKQPPLKFQSMLQKMSIDCLFKTDLKFDISWFRSIWSAFYWILWEILEWGLLHFFSLSLFYYWFLLHSIPADLVEYFWRGGARPRRRRKGAEASAGGDGDKETQEEEEEEAIASKEKENKEKGRERRRRKRRRRRWNRWRFFLCQRDEKQKKNDSSDRCASFTPFLCSISTFPALSTTRVEPNAGDWPQTAITATW